jgi:hypothetical protein
MGFWDQIMAHLTEHAVRYLIVALALGVVAAAVAVTLLLRIRSVVRPFAKVRAKTDDVGELLQAVLQTTERAESKLNRMEESFAAHLEHSKTFVQHLALVRYDAFEDVAGMQSFSMCLLNADKDGVLITYLAGKNSTRSYAVTIHNGKASRELSDEETRAVDGALSREALVHT